MVSLGARIRLAAHARGQQSGSGLGKQGATRAGNARQVTS